MYFNFMVKYISNIGVIFIFRSDDMLRYELESRGDMDGTDDSSNYHYCKFKFKIFLLNSFETFTII